MGRRKVAEMRTQALAATVLAARFRGLLGRRVAARKLADKAAAEDRAAVSIQAHERGHQARTEAARLRVARSAEDARKTGGATTIQAHARGKAARVELQRRRVAKLEEDVRREGGATTIQAHQRGRVARAEAGALRTERDRRDGAATCIQKHERRYQAALRFRIAVEAATTLEKFSRGTLARTERRRRATGRSEQRAATAMQKHVRGKRCRVEFRFKRDVIVRAQARWRRHTAMREYARARALVVRVEAAGRGAIARARYRSARRRIVRAQTEVRRWEAQVRLHRAIAAAVTLEAGGRGLLARAERRHLRRRKHARAIIGQSVVLIQRHARGVLARRLRVRLRRAKASTRIAAYARRRLARVRYPIPRMVMRVVHAQACARMQLARRRYLRARDSSPARPPRGERGPPELPPPRAAATSIQAHARGMLARRARRSALAAVRRVQSGWRRASEQRKLRKVVADARARAMLIQQIARGRAQRNRFVPQLREAREKAAEAKRQREAAIKSQNAADDSRCHLGIVRRDPSALSSMRYALMDEQAAPPDVHALYAASSAALAAARRQDAEHAECLPALAELDPRAGLAQLVEAEAKIAANPSLRYDHSGFAPDPSLALMLGTRAYKGKPSLRRNAGQWGNFDL